MFKVIRSHPFASTIKCFKSGSLLVYNAQQKRALSIHEYLSVDLYMSSVWYRCSPRLCRNVRDRS
ncbi:hypothetical protein BGT96224_692 [Blumeria graminis f. sp. tritici 96224]|uniref:Uncharacterized protein n=1 Tax=Blumeria graminis f. sp. tritici 96224 TaxID=1268274 RepID=A0A656KM78_BLUGR|nr:hypothetical protein BGT96224_692 [Blumeria graminis f. sp. tritici 96224]